MGVFSRLFGRSSHDDGSYVRTWAEKRYRELRHSNDVSLVNLFAVMMYTLSCFADRGTKKVPSRIAGLGVDAREYYSGDAALFELGCYMYFRLDFWLYKHKPDHRREISAPFATAFVKLLSQALNSSDIPSLFDQRVSQYGKLAQAGAEPQEYHFHLSQLILRTRDNQLPGPYNFEGPEPLVLNAFEEFGVKSALLTWEEHMLSAAFDMLAKYCDMTQAPAPHPEEGDHQLTAFWGHPILKGE